VRTACMMLYSGISERACTLPGRRLLLNLATCWVWSGKRGGGRRVARWEVFVGGYDRAGKRGVERRGWRRILEDEGVD